ncbi:MarR family transcriptional regulator [Streptomyces sp. M19]
MAHYTDRLLWFVKRAEQAMQQAKERALRELGITPAQQQALTVLSENEGITSAELARQCQVTPQTMTSTVGRLEAQGLLSRTPHPVHRTLVELRLTPQGRQLFERADAKVTELDVQLGEGLSPADINHLKNMLDHIALNATNADPDHPVRQFRRGQECDRCGTAANGFGDWG